MGGCTDYNEDSGGGDAKYRCRSCNDPKYSGESVVNKLKIYTNPSNNDGQLTDELLSLEKGELYCKNYCELMTGKTLIHSKKKDKDGTYCLCKGKREQNNIPKLYYYESIPEYAGTDEYPIKCKANGNNENITILPRPPKVQPKAKHDCELGGWDKSGCNKDCGGGTQIMKRQIKKHAVAGGDLRSKVAQDNGMKLTDTRRCNTFECLRCKKVNKDGKCDVVSNDQGSKLISPCPKGCNDQKPCNSGTKCVQRENGACPSGTTLCRDIVFQDHPEYIYEALSKPIPEFNRCYASHQDVHEGEGECNYQSLKKNSPTTPPTPPTTTPPKTPPKTPPTIVKTDTDNTMKIIIALTSLIALLVLLGAIFL